MAKKKTRAKPGPTRTRRERGEAVVQILTAIRLLVSSPRQPTVLAQDLGCTYRSVQRLLHGLEAGGLELTKERARNEKGHESTAVFYSLSRDALRKMLGV